MTGIAPEESSYRTFCAFTTGYRTFMVVSEALQSGVIDLLEERDLSMEELLTATAFGTDVGVRFIDLLVSMGLVQEHGGRLRLAPFSRTYLCRDSRQSQRHVIAFEKLLLENWSRLGTVLQEGQGALIRERSPAECRERLDLFQQAMGETARIRSLELWDAMPLAPARGTIIDIGAGDAVYLREFLVRHPSWQGVACDLPEVCNRMLSTGLAEKIRPYPCNILDESELSRFVGCYRGMADLLLFSNLCHCYGVAENRRLLHHAAGLLSAAGKLVIHDFFKDTGSFGAMYDLHMLVNTYNGRCYSTCEMGELLKEAGFSWQTVVELPSGSLAIVAVLRSNCG